MPCTKYKGKQRNLCFAGWKKPKYMKMFKTEKKEHPSFTNKQVWQIVKDHSRK